MLGATSMDLTGGGGDIWSTGAFSFDSPLKDLLDSGEFTLEQLLAEDELLQELRGCHQKLMAFFSTEEAVTKLVQYVILPQNNNDNDNTSKDEDNKNTDEAPAPQMNGETCGPAPLFEVEQKDEKESTEPKQKIQWLNQHLEEIKSGNKTKEPEKDPLLKHIRFPYMACEIICCEINGIIDTLVNGNCKFENKEPEQPTVVTATDNNNNDVNDNTEHSEAEIEVTARREYPILDYLFSLLHDTPVGELDDYRAGYFDKVLTVLFRKHPEDLTQYINTGGTAGRDALMQSMMRHLYSHSIMQIAQRLLLPQRPIDQQQQQDGMNGGGGDEIVAGDDDMEGMVQCDWSDSPEVLDMLTEKLIGPDRKSVVNTMSDVEQEQLLDLSLNASEVLITIIQNSMLSSPAMLSLTSSENISRFVDAATTLPGDGDYFSPHESLLTSAMNVLESLILQLGGYGAVGAMSLLADEEAMLQQQQQLQDQQQQGSTNEVVPSSEQQDDSVNKKPQSPEESSSSSSPPSADTDTAETADIENAGGDDQLLIADLTSMLEHLPRLLSNLSILLRHPSTKTWTSPTQFSKNEPQQVLGNSRLRIIRVLESLVLLGDPDIDAKLVQSDCLDICLDFFWQFQWCSMLHQSVANLLVHIFEGQNTRVEIQQYFLVKCNLLGRLMDSFVEDEVTHAAAGIVGLPTSNEDEVKIEDLVENLQDVNLSADHVSSVNSEKGSLSDGPLPISEDDVEAAMEAAQNNDKISGSSVENFNVEQTSTEAVRFESRDVSTVGDVNAAPPPQAFRFGYMGHVIIICQALVHAYTNPPEQEMADAEAAEAEANAAGGSFGMVQENGLVREENDPTPKPDNVNAADESPKADDGNEEPFTPRDDFGEPLILFEIVQTHQLADRWNEFVETTLAAETAVQSTPLGGFSMQGQGFDPMQVHRPGLADEGYMMGDDGEGPPAPPRGMLGGGDVIDMDDNDLEMAANMMAGMNIRKSSPSPGDGDDSSNNSGDSDRSYNSGETASEKTGYAFDDPLGKAGGLGIELGKLTQYKYNTTKESKNANKSGNTEDDDGENSHSSSDEEPDSQQSGDGDVPVMDLFAGNFDYGESSQQEKNPEEAPKTEPIPEFANFADFDAASPSDDDFGPFSGPATTTEPLVEQSEKQKNNFDDIFGKGDHASLLEQEETPKNPFITEEKASEDETPTTTNPTDSTTNPAEVPKNPFITEEEKAAEDSTTNTTDPVVESSITPGAENKSDEDEKGAIQAGHDGLLRAPSDELEADIEAGKDSTVSSPEQSKSEGE